MKKSNSSLPQDTNRGENGFGGSKYSTTKVVITRCLPQDINRGGNGFGGSGEGNERSHVEFKSRFLTYERIAIHDQV